MKGAAQDPRIRVTAVCSRSAETAVAFANRHALASQAKIYTSVEELVSDPQVDAIYIGTPNQTHCEYALAGLKAGKHVLCEKPLAINVQEGRRLIAADPRCNFIITADCAATLMDLFREVYSRRGWHSKKPGLPVYFLSGDDDPCMISFKKFVRSVGCMRACGYSDVNSRTYAGMRHEILHEIKKQSVWDDILTVFNR